MIGADFRFHVRLVRTYNTHVFTRVFVIKGERRKKRVYRLALTCVGEQGLVVGAIVKFRPHAEGELLQVRQVRLVADVLQEEVKSLDRMVCHRRALRLISRLSRFALTMRAIAD